MGRASPLHINYPNESVRALSQITGHPLRVNNSSKFFSCFLATDPSSWKLFDLPLINNRDKQLNSSRI